MIGQSLAHYEILEKIGEGGMGEVYRARDTQLGREVAIKILPEIFSSDPERLARFEREARLLASLNHPGIAIVHGLHEETGTRFLAMELVPGQDLSASIRQQPPSRDETISIALQVAQALEVAHEQGVIHRDLKPSNIMITPDGRAKVLDFGLAKSLEVNPHDMSLANSPTISAGTMQGVILGTAAYMSPEQARGKPLDRRCDIWSYGVILYEMLTGRQLFTGETVSDTMAEVLKAEIELDALPAGTPPNLVALLRRCLDRDPNSRLRDVGEARITLARIQAGDEGEAATVADPSVQPGFLRTWGGWVLAGAALAVAVFAFMSREPSPEPTTKVPLRKWTVPMSREDSSLGERFMPALSPDGRYLVYSSRDQLWVRDLASTEPRLLAGTEGAANPFWSPDAKWIGFGLEQSVRKIPREGGSHSLVASLPDNMNLTSLGSGGAWTEDGRVILGTGVSGLMGAPAQGGDMTTAVETAVGESDFHEVTVLPEGNGLLFVVHDSTGYGKLDVWTLGGARTRILEIDDSVESPCYSPSGHVVFHRVGDAAGIWAFPFSLERLERTGEPFLVAAGGFNPSVSRDGTLAYVTGLSVNKAQMVVVNRDGEIVDEVGPAETVSRPFPEISRDDQWVLHAANFGDGREIYRYHLTTHNRQRLTFNDLREDLAVFHPNGRDILYYETNEFWTYLHPLQGGGQPRQLVQGVMAVVTEDGTRVVLSRKREKNFVWDLFMRDLDGGEESLVELVATSGIDWFPQLSPDETHVAYTSDETGHEEVYITTFPTPTVRWQISTDGGSIPRWKADGRELFYATRDAILSVTVNTEGGFSFTSPALLFRRPHIDWNSRWFDGYDVTGDGERFVLFRPILEEDGEDPAIVLVQNWFEEFRRDAGGAGSAAQ